MGKALWSGSSGLILIDGASAANRYEKLSDLEYILEVETIGLADE